MNSKGHATFGVVLGIAMLLLFFWGLLLQVQTSEAMILGQGTTEISFTNWSILLQLLNMFFVPYSFSTAMSIFLAWSIECGYFAALIFHEKAKDAVSGSGKHMEGLFFLGIVVCVVYNMISDYKIGALGSGPAGHFFFAMLASFVEAFFGIVGIKLIHNGWKSA